MSYPGTVTVLIKSVDNVPVADLTSSDPYLTIEIGGNKQKTTVKKSELNPVYNECLIFSLYFYLCFIYIT